MTHRKRAIWTERLLLGLILASLGATLNLLVHHPSPLGRQAVISRPEPILAPQPSTPVLHRFSDSSTVASSFPRKRQFRRSRSRRTQISRTRQNSSPSGRPHQRRRWRPGRRRPPRRSKQAGRRIGARLALQAACESAVAESQRWKRREMLVRQQIAGLTDRAAQLERDAESLDAERDVLAHERDALKAALTKASRRSGFAVLPYKGPNGTWRRPIVLECTAGGVKLQPQGRTFHVPGALAAASSSIEPVRAGDRPRAAAHSIGRYAGRSAGRSIPCFPGATGWHPRLLRGPHVP